RRHRGAGPRQSRRLALGGLGRRRLHGRARDRERPRLRLRLALLLVGGLRRRLLRRVVLEDRLLGLARKQALELLLVDRLTLDEDQRDLVELVDVLLEDDRGVLVRFFDDAPDLVVDLPRDLFRVVRLGAHLATEERHVVVAAEDAGAELLAHTEAHHHLFRGRRHLLEVVRRAGRHLVEDDLLGCATAQRHRKLVHQVLLRRQVAVLAGQRDRVPERLAAADDRDLVDLGLLVEVVADDRVAELVVRGDLPLLLREQTRLLLGAGDHTHDPFFQLVLLDRLLAAPRCTPPR